VLAHVLTGCKAREAGALRPALTEPGKGRPSLAWTVAPGGQVGYACQARAGAVARETSSRAHDQAAEADKRDQANAEAVLQALATCQQRLR
jgi:hypothetical protein